MNAAEALIAARDGGVLLALIALRQLDDELLLALDQNQELVAIVERAASESRGGNFAGALRTALHRLDELRSAK